jgi:hypothetical protein
MKLERFQKLLDVLGGELAAWPEAEREAAERLLASDPRACSALEQARRLDSLIRRSLCLERVHDAAAGEAAGRVLARLTAGRLPEQKGAGWMRAARVLRERAAFAAASPPFWTGLATLACAGALGIAMGVLLAPELFVSQEPERHAGFVESDPGAFVFSGEPDAGPVL